MVEVTEALRELLQRHVDAGRIPGAVGVHARAGDEPEIVAVGAASLGDSAMRPDAIFRIQSMTKVITAVAALRLVAHRQLSLDDSVTRWLPELADRRVLTSPAAELHDTRPAGRDITLRHLLTNTSGYGMILQPSPLQDAMLANGTEAGPEPLTLSADEWLSRLAELPLAFDPGEGWRYHHSFGLLGILLSRVAGRPLIDFLGEEIFDSLMMSDTSFWVRPSAAGRLPAAYRLGKEGLVETEPAGGGFYVERSLPDISHGELVSTAADFFRFIAAVVEDPVGGRRVIEPGHRRLLTADQVPASAKTPDSFFPGFWEGMGWGFGVAVHTTGPHRRRWGWSGGQGTDFYVDPDGTIGVLLTQVELGPELWPLVAEFQEVG